MSKTTTVFEKILTINDYCQPVIYFLYVWTFFIPETPTFTVCSLNIDRIKITKWTDLDNAYLNMIFQCEIDNEMHAIGLVRNYFSIKVLCPFQALINYNCTLR